MWSPFLSDYGSATWPQCPRKVWRNKSCRRYAQESGPEVDQWPSGLATSPTLLPLPRLYEQYVFTVIRGVFRVFLGLLLPWPPTKEKWVWKWLNLLLLVTSPVLVWSYRVIHTWQNEDIRFWNLIFRVFTFVAISHFLRWFIWQSKIFLAAASLTENLFFWCHANLFFPNHFAPTH